MAHTRFANSLQPPYYAVMFISLRTQKGDEEYAAAAARMAALAAVQPGFLGIESTRGSDPYAAARCTNASNGRPFGGRKT